MPCTFSWMQSSRAIDAVATKYCWQRLSDTLSRLIWSPPTLSRSIKDPLRRCMSTSCLHLNHLKQNKKKLYLVQKLIQITKEFKIQNEPGGRSLIFQLDDFPISDAICFIGIVKRNGNRIRKLFRWLLLHDDSFRRWYKTLPESSGRRTCCCDCWRWIRAEYDAQLLNTERANFSGLSIDYWGADGEDNAASPILYAHWNVSGCNLSVALSGKF